MNLEKKPHVNQTYLDQFASGGGLEVSVLAFCSDDTSLNLWI